MAGTTLYITRASFNLSIGGVGSLSKLYEQEIETPLLVVQNCLCKIKRLLKRWHPAD